MPVLNVWSQHSTDLQFDEFLNVILIYGVGDDKQSNLKRINMIKFTVPINVMLRKFEEGCMDHTVS